MQAIDMLKQQHREVERLFDKIAEGQDEQDPEGMRRTFNQLADALAIHATVEERHFYPSVKAKDTEPLLEHSVEEHAAQKSLLAEIMHIGAATEAFFTKVKELQDMVEEHVGAEEDHLFPAVEKIFDEEKLDALGDDMAATEAELREAGAPRTMIREESAHPE